MLKTTSYKKQLLINKCLIVEISCEHLLHKLFINKLYFTFRL